MEYKKLKHNLPNNNSEEFNLYPKDWQIKKLGEVCLIKKGQLITENTRIDGSIPVIAGGKTPAYFHNKANRNGKTITISASGANAGYISFHNYPIFASDCSTIAQSPNYSIEYIFFLLSLNQEKIYKMQTGGAQPHIHPKDLYPITIFLPKIEEQNAIANVLSETDELIENLEKLISKKKAIRKGVMQQLLTGKKRLPGFCGKWEIKKLGDIFKVTRGQVLSTKKMRVNKMGDFKYPVYSSQTLNDGLTGFYNEFLFENAITWTTDGANAGEVNFRKGKFYCTNVCGVLLNRDGYANRCVAETFGLVSKKYVSYVGNPKLMNNIVKIIPVFIPSDVKEQNAISVVLNDIDIDLKNLEIKLEKYRQIKVGMMQQLLTGKIRLVRK